MITSKRFSELAQKAIDSSKVNPGPSSQGKAPLRRLRMRARLANTRPDTLADDELLELVLLCAMPQREAKKVAHALLKKFQTFAGAVAAPPRVLEQLDGLGKAGIAALKMIQASSIRLARADIGDEPINQKKAELISYLLIALGRDKQEMFHVLYFNAGNRLLADEVEGSGTIDHCPVYIRNIGKRALELDATAVLLAHNHPSGSTRPSDDDIEITHAVVLGLELLSITVLDHIIVAPGRWMSFSDEGLLDPRMLRSRAHHKP